MSSLIPGLGQAYNGRSTSALRLFVPYLVVVTFAVLALVFIPTPHLLAEVIAPRTLQGLLVLNVLVLGWRVFALGQAFFDRRFELRPGGLAAAGLALILVITVAPHLVVGYLGGVTQTTFSRIFSGGVLAAESDSHPGPVPAPGQRINILLVGTDRGAGRDHTLTDSMIVVSIDPIGKSVSMASLPRDLVGVPLGDGRTFDPKLNSLMEYAVSHPKEFPQGGMRALEDAVGALLGIPIHYFATIDLSGFVKMVDAVGGVDVTVRKPLADPNYGGFGIPKGGWSVDPGRHHFDGANALAYTRIRHSQGETDFTRQARQQQILLALRDRVVRGGALFSLPSLVDAVGDTIATDLPPERLPDLAVLAGEIAAKRIVRVVIRWPLVHPGEPNSRYGAVQVPDFDRIRVVAALLFPSPGTDPTGWKPGQTPWASPMPSVAPSPAGSPPT